MRDINVEGQIGGIIMTNSNYLMFADVGSKVSVHKPRYELIQCNGVEG